MAATETIVLSEKRVYVAVMEFGDSTMITGRVSALMKILEN